MKKSWIIIGVVALFLIIIIAVIIGSYNSMVSKNELVETKLSDIDTQLQRRMDLIPNLVNSVKGIMDHEQEAIDKVTTAREHLVNAKELSEKADADAELTNALNSFIVIAENYPDLKASQNYTSLMDELAGTENRIATARRDYNEAVNDYNTYIKKFPNMMFAGMFGFSEKDRFEAKEGADEVPEVKFD